MTPTKKAAAPKKTKAKAAKKPKKEKTPREPLVVFAFRLTAPERDLIHKAAGPSKASKFLKAAALAAAHGDSKAFEVLTGEAKANLSGAVLKASALQGNGIFERWKICQK